MSRSSKGVQSSEPRASRLAAGDAHRRARQLAQGAISIDRVDAGAFRDWFRVAFARYLQSNFRNAEAVATSYGVRFQTALNWWNGENTASGETVARTLLDPAARAWFDQEWTGQA
ncbi:hypothetical protein OEW28_18740 [Defluviimonas sp. WL0002]|uniref:Uncharacterized protein n=1 Tax=Albidovulum marisflavi TaxID=2984159 RepID=A0ABT2ZHY7_9RHOB|nr:hypothetical protein [Defluviimonas sp. WL0002]MCV2870655.1 hypothetical protein [Defluviimonas sp. WL0002]